MAELFNGQKFAFVMGLGADCEVAVRLNQYNCKSLRSIFDNVGIPLPHLLDLLEGRIRDFAALPNLIIKSDLKYVDILMHERKKELRVVDKKYNAELWHYFSYNQTIEEQYEDVIKKINSLIDRFFQEILTTRPILFVRKQSLVESLFVPEDVKNQYRRLYNCLKGLRLEKPFSILALGHEDVFAEDWGISGVESRQLIHRNKCAVWSPDGYDMTFIDKVWQQVAEAVEPTKIF